MLYSFWNCFQHEGSLSFLLYKYELFNGLLLKEMQFWRARLNSGRIDTTSFLFFSISSCLSFWAFFTIFSILTVSIVKRTSHSHCLSIWFQSFSAGRYLRISCFPLAWLRKSSIARPFIEGTADTLTFFLFIYYS